MDIPGEFIIYVFKYKVEMLVLNFQLQVLQLLSKLESLSIQLMIPNTDQYVTPLCVYELWQEKVTSISHSHKPKDFCIYALSSRYS